MKLSEIDINFVEKEGLDKELNFFSPEKPPFSVWGLAEHFDGKWCRLPMWFLPECSIGVQELVWNLSGGCVRFSTDSSVLGVVWRMRSTGVITRFAATGQSGMQLMEEKNDGTVVNVGTVQPVMDNGHGCKKNQAVPINLPGGYRHYVLYLPLYNGFESFALGFEPQARIGEGRSPRIKLPVVFYGSSITQGGCATKAGNSYTTILSRRLDFAQINLGFSGSGMGESNMAEYISTLPMSAFVMDYDHNAPDTKHLCETHSRFFRIVREKNPELPIIMMTRPDFDKNPELARANREVIRTTYKNARDAGDRNVYFVDGESFYGYGSAERDMCDVDGTHPNDLGFIRIADILTPLLNHILQGGKNDADS